MIACIYNRLIGLWENVKGPGGKDIYSSSPRKIAYPGSFVSEPV
jgi:hypothetical protein